MSRHKNRRRVHLPPRLEPLEDRRLLAADPVGDTLATAFPVAPFAERTEIAGRIDAPGDVDVYRVHLAAGQRLVARAAGADDLDTFLRLFDARGNELDRV